MKLLGIDQAGGETRKWYADGEGGVVIEHSQDVSAVLEANKKVYNQVDERARWGEFDRVAEIPNSVIADLNVQGIMRGFTVVDQKRMKAFLNDPANRYLRTRPGRV